MDKAEVASLAQHINDSWPNQPLEPVLAEKWVEDFKPLDFQAMIVAVDRLRLTQDLQPTTAQLMRMYAVIQKEWELPALPPIAEQDPKRPFNTSWRLLMETWVVLRQSRMRLPDEKINPWAERAYVVVTQEIKALHAKTLEMMPNGPDAVAPLNLVALAVAARERVRALLFEGSDNNPKASAGVQDAPKKADRLVTEEAAPVPSAPPIHVPPVPQPDLPDEPPNEPEDIFA